MNYYIAFSITGTNCFITATTQSAMLALNTPGFKMGKSRRNAYNKHNETKIVWDKLNKKNGQPHTSPTWVMRRFHELERMGWEIDSKRFRQKHFPKK